MAKNVLNLPLPTPTREEFKKLLLTACINQDEKTLTALKKMNSAWFFEILHDLASFWQDYCED